MQRLPREELMEDAALIREHQRAALMTLNVALGQVYRLRLKAPDRAHAVDLGVGLGGLSLRMASRHPHWVIDAVDGSRPILAAATENLKAAQLERRVALHWARLPADRLQRGGYRVVMSSGLLHHLRDPQLLWRTVKRLGAPGAQVVIADLVRQPNDELLRNAVLEFAPGASPAVQGDLVRSYRAAYVPREVQTQLERAGLGNLHIETTDPKFCVVWGELPRHARYDD